MNLLISRGIRVIDILHSKTKKKKIFNRGSISLMFRNRNKGKNKIKNFKWHLVKEPG